MNEAIYEKREAAAVMTKGMSSDVIYAAIRATMNRIGAKGDLLDFGSGAGACLRELHRSGQFKSLSGVDIMKRPPGLAEEIRWETADLNNPTPFHEESFDVILSSEVIEHLENPRALFREWRRLLRPQGFVVCSTPNNESLRSMVAWLGRGHFAGFGDASYPAHITALLRKDFERICLEAPLRLIDFTFTDSGGIPGFPATTWQKISGGFCRGIRFSDNLIVVAQKTS